MKNLGFLRTCFLFLAFIFSNVAFSTEVLIGTDDAGNSVYSFEDESNQPEITETKSASPALKSSRIQPLAGCTGTITSTISMTQILGGSSQFYPFSQSVACNNQYASINITNYSNAWLRRGLQVYQNGAWQWKVTLGTSNISMKLPTGSYRWVVYNASNGITGSYAGYYDRRF